VQSYKLQFNGELCSAFYKTKTWPYCGTFLPAVRNHIEIFSMHTNEPKHTNDYQFIQDKKVKKTKKVKVNWITTYFPIN